VNKLLMYYQGGGACWDDATCSLPTCEPDENANGRDEPNGIRPGCGDREGPPGGAHRRTQAGRTGGRRRR
ncbi:MAG: hypothetical protein ACKONH_00050, partial [Planctomycetia bacterium]